MENDKDLASTTDEGSRHAVRSSSAVRRKQISDEPGAIAFQTDCGCYIFITEEKALGISYCHLHSAAPELLEACVFVKAFLNKLEGGLDADDPLTALREKFHAPLHAKLDVAITKAQNTTHKRTLRPDPAPQPPFNKKDSK